MSQGLNVTHAQVLKRAQPKAKQDSDPQFQKLLQSVASRSRYFSPGNSAGREVTRLKPAAKSLSGALAKVRGSTTQLGEGGEVGSQQKLKLNSSLVLPSNLSQSRTGEFERERARLAKAMRFKQKQVSLEQQRQERLKRLQQENEKREKRKAEQAKKQHKTKLQ
jgi:hypothetical protein